jgi:hypothetical protein
VENTHSSKEDLFMSRVTITAQVVEAAKRELIEKLKSNIDLDQVKAICRQQYGIEKIEGIDIKNGDIVSHNNQVAYRLDFDVHFSMPMLIDGEGNCTSTLTESGDELPTSEDHIEEAGRQAAIEHNQF